VVPQDGSMKNLVSHNTRQHPPYLK